MATRITSQAIAQIQEVLTAAASRGAFEPLAVLRQLRSLGFAGCRYYDVAQEAIIKDQSLVLSAYDMDSPPRAEGLKIRLRDATLGRSGLLLRPTISSSTSAATTAQSEWIAALSLAGKSWIDVPVKQGAELVGVLACDWWGEPSVLSPDDVEALTLIANLIASAEQEVVQFNVASFSTRLVEKIEGGQPTPPRVSDLLDAGLGFVREALDAPVWGAFPIRLEI